MNTLLEYIGPIILLILIISYSFYRRFHPDTKDTKQPPRCPKCKSIKLQTYTPSRKQYSRKAGMFGHALNGVEGAMFAMLYEADRTYYRCQYCGHRFSRKENRFISNIE
ncbi:TPA: hypothetical protein TXJ05_000844 [Streptococcus suis]|nr:hypothetical protein [Streptococcus suis]